MAFKHLWSIHSIEVLLIEYLQCERVQIRKSLRFLYYHQLSFGRHCTWVSHNQSFCHRLHYFVTTDNKRQPGGTHLRYFLGVSWMVDDEWLVDGSQSQRKTKFIQFYLPKSPFQTSREMWTEFQLDLHNTTPWTVLSLSSVSTALSIRPRCTGCFTGFVWCMEFREGTLRLRGIYLGALSNALTEIAKGAFSKAFTFNCVIN